MTQIKRDPDDPILLQRWPQTKLLTELMPLAKAKAIWMILSLFHVDSTVNNNDNWNPQSQCVGVGI